MKSASNLISDYDDDVKSRAALSLSLLLLASCCLHNSICNELFTQAKWNTNIFFLFSCSCFHSSMKNSFCHFLFLRSQIDSHDSVSNLFIFIIFFLFASFFSLQINTEQFNGKLNIWKPNDIICVYVFLSLGLSHLIFNLNLLFFIHSSLPCTWRRNFTNHAWCCLWNSSQVLLGFLFNLEKDFNFILFQLRNKLETRDMEKNISKKLQYFSKMLKVVNKHTFIYYFLNKGKNLDLFNECVWGGFLNEKFIFRISFISCFIQPALTFVHKWSNNKLKAIVISAAFNP